MKAFLRGWSKMQLRVLGIGAALVVAGVGIAFAQAPNAPSKPPPSPDAAAAPPAPPAPAMPATRAVMLTEQEIRIIIAMGEECIKAKGYDCAEPALIIRQKLQPPPPPVAAPPAPPK